MTESLPSLEALAEEEELLAARVRPIRPPGVLPPQPNGTRQGMFWIHDLSVDLAKIIGDDQPCFAVLLTPEDFSSLGEKQIRGRHSGR